MANRKGAKTGKGNVQKQQAQKKAEGAALRRLTEKAVQGVHEAAKAEAITVAATDVDNAEEDKKQTTKKRPGRRTRTRRARARAKQSSATTFDTRHTGEDIMPGSNPQAAPTPAQEPAPVPATGGASGAAVSVSTSPSISTAQVTVTTPTPYIRPRWMEGRKPILSYSLDATTQESSFLSKSIAEGYSKRIVDLSSELNATLQKEGEQFLQGGSIPGDPKQKAAYVQKRLEFAQKRLELEKMKNLARKGRESGGGYNNAKLDLLRWKMEVIDPTKNQAQYDAAKKEYENFALQVSNSRLQKHLKKLLDLCNLSDDQKTPEMEKEAQFLLKQVKKDIALYNGVFNANRGIEISQASETHVLVNQSLKTSLEAQQSKLKDVDKSKFLPAKPQRDSSNLSNEPTPYERFVAAKVEEEVKAEMAKRSEKWDEKSSEEQYQIMKEAIRRRSKQQDMIEAFAKGGDKVQGAITKPGVCEYKVTGGKIVEKDGKNGVSYAIEGNVNSTIKVPRRNKDGSISTTSFDVLEIVNGEPHLHLSDDLTTTCRLDVKEMGKYIENQRNAKPVVIDHGQEVQVKSVGAISPSATPKASQGAAQGAARGT